MKTFVILLALAAIARPSLRGGTIVGSARAEGKTPAQGDDAGGAYASRKYKFAEKVDYDAMRDFVVYIKGPLGTNTVIPPSNHVIVNTTRIKQEGAEFRPRVVPVVAGTTVEWPNNDQIFHNVFSVSDAKNFDLGLYRGNPEDKRITFDKAGRVDVFCSIHANMHCVVLVLENPYFAVTDDKNHYSISNVPPGTYQLTAWHERMPSQTREITVPASGEVKTDFVLGITGLPKY
jgi:plastocyanin